jgi:hypothetical protein
MLYNTFAVLKTAGRTALTAFTAACRGMGSNKIFTSFSCAFFSAYGKRLFIAPLVV